MSGRVGAAPECGARMVLMSSPVCRLRAASAARARRRAAGFATAGGSPMRRQGVRPRGRGSPVAHARNRACGKDRIERYIEQWHIGRIPNI
ncbi:hypothetical protein DP43_5718 [Burkholderia pseudomallei]|nr:hypothetical protein DP43_5718 [Burkholderia pseudomallei]